LGLGLLESAYAACLEVDFGDRRLSFAKEVARPLHYKDARVDAAYRMDFVVEGSVVVEVKCVNAGTDIHRAQLLTYLRLSRHRPGLLFNFNQGAPDAVNDPPGPVTPPCLRGRTLWQYLLLPLSFVPSPISSLSSPPERTTLRVRITHVL